MVGSDGFCIGDTHDEYVNEIYDMRQMESADENKRDDF
jgi:hypothetical protein